MESRTYRVVFSSAVTLEFRGRVGEDIVTRAMQITSAADEEMGSCVSVQALTGESITPKAHTHGYRVAFFDEQNVCFSNVIVYCAKGIDVVQAARDEEPAAANWKLNGIVPMSDCFGCEYQKGGQDEHREGCLRNLWGSDLDDDDDNGYVLETDNNDNDIVAPQISVLSCIEQLDDSDDDEPAQGAAQVLSPKREQERQSRARFVACVYDEQVYLIPWKALKAVGKSSVLQDMQRSALLGLPFPFQKWNLDGVRVFDAGNGGLAHCSVDRMFVS